MTTTTATIQYWPMDRIEANPWQPRAEQDAAKTTSIAASVRANREADPNDPQRGLLQVPLARPHPAKPGWVQLQFGHTRQAALRSLGDDDMPLVIRAATDRQMADRAAQENIERKDLSAIEIAHAIKRYIADFGVTQAEAGKVYGYSSQSSVSNLLRLLDLPEAVQQYVRAGELPERHARELVTLVREERQKRERRKRNVVLVKQVAPLFAPAMALQGRMLTILHERLDYMTDSDKKKWAAAGDDARRADIVGKLLLVSSKADDYNTPSTPELQRWLEDLARSTNIRLPAGWADAQAPAPSANGKTKSKGGKSK